MPKTKNPICYYGGKTSMLKHILPRIPKHTIYTEAFFGGGAVFFAKEPVESETINDINDMVINFYEIERTQFEQLKKKVQSTLFSRRIYSVAYCVYKAPHLFDKLIQAWAFYVGTNMGFACNIGSWGYDKYGKKAKSFLNKKMSFDESIAQRLESVQVECNDACKVIKSRDSVDSFHYVDPPYIDTDQGCYKGYGKDDYQRLLETLSNVKGKFLLSSFPSELLDDYIEKNGWYSIQFSKKLTASKANGQKRKEKIEVLTANYII